MDYKKHYNLLISSRIKSQDMRYKLRKSRKNKKSIDNYFEKHHIIPKCLGGTNDKSNLILLTAREHYVAHWLLTKIYLNNKKLKYAMWMLSTSAKYISNNSRSYEMNKLIFIESISGENNPNYGKLGKKRSIESKRKMSIAQTGVKHSQYGTLRSDETKEKISKSNIGKIMPIKTKIKISKALINRSLSIEHKLNISNNHTRLNTMPWEQPLVIKNGLLYNWTRLDMIYNLWINNDKPKQGKLSTISICKDSILKPSSSFGNMIKWFYKNGNPINNICWKNFKNTQDKIYEII